MTLPRQINRCGISPATDQLFGPWRVSSSFAETAPPRARATSVSSMISKSRDESSGGASVRTSGIEPLSDIRGTAAYKREMVRVHTRRALASALSGEPTL